MEDQENLLIGFLERPLFDCKRPSGRFSLLNGGGELHRRVIRREVSSILTTQFSIKQPNKPDAFWKEVLRTDQVRIELLATMSKGMFKEKEAQNLMKRKPP